MKQSSLARRLNAGFARIRHWRGHGVHSPFAYRFAREVFMKRRCHCAAGLVYDTLAEEGCKSRQAGLVQSAYSFLNCSIFVLNGKMRAQTGEAERSMYVFTPSATITDRELTEVCSSAVCVAVCLLSHGSDPQWYETCRKTVAAHHGMSIDCRSAIFLFTSEGLNKENIKL